jgi:hypothetical protein
MSRPPLQDLTREEIEDVLSKARLARRAPGFSGHFTDLDLSGLDFTSNYKEPSGLYSAVYIGIDLRSTNLSHTNFMQTDLAAANLRGTDLSEANLQDANMYNVLLEGARLRHTNLRGANLYSAELQEVDVQGADFTDASFGQTAIGAVDLSKAHGLGASVHQSPSQFDSVTFRLTAAGLAAIPEFDRTEVLKFFRNAGVEDELLDIIRTWIGKPVEFYSTFLSHSSLDKAFARRLYEDLRAIGVNCWLDEKEILPGDKIVGAIDRGIRLADKVILVCSEQSLSPRTGWWVEQELERALSKERELRTSGAADVQVLIPITLDNYVFQGWSSGYKATVLERHIGDFREASNPREYARHLDRLRRAVNAARSV